jgi:hypothetical protein
MGPLAAEDSQHAVSDAHRGGWTQGEFPRGDILAART